MCQKFTSWSISKPQLFKWRSWFTLKHAQHYFFAKEVNLTVLYILCSCVLWNAELIPKYSLNYNVPTNLKTPVAQLIKPGKARCCQECNVQGWNKSSFVNFLLVNRIFTERVVTETSTALTSRTGFSKDSVILYNKLFKNGYRYFMTDATSQIATINFQFQ